MNFYKRHIGDYIKKAGHLTLLEHGIYARLMDVYYTREAGIPEDKAARLIGARTKDEQQALANVLDEFFTLVDGVWTQGRCEEEIGNANAQAEANRNNGKKGGRPKRKGTEEEPKENPMGFDSLSEKNLSQTPDSRLQTPDFGNGAAIQPELRAPDPVEVVTAAGQITIAMKAFGISANPGSLIIRQLAAQGVDAETVTAACEEAKRTKPTEAIGPAYIVRIIERWAADAAKLNAAGATQPRTSPRQAQQANTQRLLNRIQGTTSHEPDPRIIDINDRPA